MKAVKGSEIIETAKEMDETHAFTYNSRTVYPIVVSCSNNRCLCFEELLRDKVVVPEETWLKLKTLIETLDIKLSIRVQKLREMELDNIKLRRNYQYCQHRDSLLELSEVIVELRKLILE